MGRGECYAKAARLDAEIGYGAASLLLDSVVLGLESIQESYGKKYIKIATKEV